MSRIRQEAEKRLGMARDLLGGEKELRVFGNYHIRDDGDTIQVYLPNDFRVEFCAREGFFTCVRDEQRHELSSRLADLLASRASRDSKHSMADILASDPFGLLGNDKPTPKGYGLAVLASGEVAEYPKHLSLIHI